MLLYGPLHGLVRARQSCRTSDKCHVCYLCMHLRLSPNAYSLTMLTLSNDTIALFAGTTGMTSTSRKTSLTCRASLGGACSMLSLQRDTRTAHLYSYLATFPHLPTLGERLAPVSTVRKASIALRGFESRSDPRCHHAVCQVCTAHHAHHAVCQVCTEHIPR